MRSWLFVLVVASLAAGCAGTPAAPYSTTPLASETKTQVVPMNGSFPALIRAPTGHAIHVSARVNVTDGGPIDVWLVTANESLEYLTRNFTATARALNVTHATLVADFEAPDAENRYYLILDNSPFAKGEAKPVGNVTATYTIDLWNRA